SIFHVMGILDPHKIVLGGGVVNKQPKFYQLILDKFQLLCKHPLQKNWVKRIEKSLLLGDSGLHGVAVAERVFRIYYTYYKYKEGSTMFNMTKGEIEEKGAVHTSAEINQQPVVWKELTNGFVENNDERKKFVKSIFNKHDRVRVIFTGAGTSAFVGDTITPVLNQINADHIEFTSIPTTDIVSNPEQYLHRDIPTMMVSMARSGNSPESVAAVELGQKRVNYFYQVVITCNEEGKLVKNTKDDENS